jgi:hypothetical protein
MKKGKIKTSVSKLHDDPQFSVLQSDESKELK